MAIDFQAAFLRAPEAILLFDDDGDILAANEAAAVLFGVPPFEIAGKNLGLFGPSAAYDFRPGIRGLVQAGSHRGELRMSRGNGDVFDAEYQSRANVLPGIHETIVRDISDRKRVETSLRASEQLFSRALIASPAATCVSVRASGACLLANEQFLQLTGYWRSEVIGSTLATGKLWANPAERRRIESELESGVAIVPFAATLRRKDGSDVRVFAAIATGEINGQECELLSALQAE